MAVIGKHSMVANRHIMLFSMTMQGVCSRRNFTT